MADGSVRAIPVRQVVDIHEVVARVAGRVVVVVAVAGLTGQNDLTDGLGAVTVDRVEPAAIGVGEHGDGGGIRLGAAPDAVVGVDDDVETGFAGKLGLLEAGGVVDRRRFDDLAAVVAFIQAAGGGVVRLGVFGDIGEHEVGDPVGRSAEVDAIGVGGENLEVVLRGGRLRRAAILMIAPDAGTAFDVGHHIGG